MGASVTGIDPLEDNIRTAELHKSFDPVLAKRIQYKSCSLEDLVEENLGTFDILVASEVVEHVADVEMFVRCCGEVLKVSSSENSFKTKRSNGLACFHLQFSSYRVTFLTVEGEFVIPTDFSPPIVDL